MRFAAPPPCDPRLVPIAALRVKMALPPGDDDEGAAQTALLRKIDRNDRHER